MLKSVGAKTEPWGTPFLRRRSRLTCPPIAYLQSTIPLHTGLWLQRLLCVTVALNWLITLHILLIWHHLTIKSSPTWKKNTSLRSSIGPMMKSYLQLRTFSRIRMRTSIPRESKRCNTTPTDEVCGSQERPCWKINHIWSNSTIAS